MPRNLSRVLVDTFTIAAGASSVVDIDTTTMVNLQLMTEVSYASTSSTTGISLDLQYGFGDPDPDATMDAIVVGGTDHATFGDTVDPVTMETVTANSGVAVAKRTVFNIDVLKIPRWLRLVFTNLDSTYASTVKIYGDL